jgi:hypothetical protein
LAGRPRKRRQGTGTVGVSPYSATPLGFIRRVFMSDNTISSETDDSAKAVSYPKLPPRAFASMSAEEYIDQRLN